MKDLPDTKILEFCKLKISEKQQELLSDLLAKNQEGELTIDEEKQLDELIIFSEDKTLQKAEALRIAFERGLISESPKQKTPAEEISRDVKSRDFVNSYRKYPLSFIAPTILLIIGELSNKDSYSTKIWLQRKGYNVNVVNSFSDAIEVIIDFTLGNRPTIILLDCNTFYLDIGDLDTEKGNLLQVIAQDINIPLVALVSNESDSIGLEKTFLQVKNLDSFESLIQEQLTIQLKAVV